MEEKLFYFRRGAPPVNWTQHPEYDMDYDEAVETAREIRAARLAEATDDPVGPDTAPPVEAAL